MLHHAMPRRRALLLGGGLLAAPGSLHAQVFPNRPLRIVAPYAAGGLADLMSRAIAQTMSLDLGQPVVVEPRPGANTIIGHQAVVQSPPDGHSMVFTSGAGYVVNPLVYRNMPFDPERDLRVIGIIVETPFVMVVPGNSPARSVADLVAMARARPEGLDYASVGRGNPLELAAEMFRLAAGVTLTGIVYNGSAPSHAALMRGEVALMMDVLGSAMPLLRDGRLRALAVTTATRVPLLPDVPTMAEAGLPDASASTWFGLAVPRATPEPVVQRLMAAIHAVQRDDAFRTRFGALGMYLQPERDQAAIDAHLASERARWRRVVEENRLALDAPG